VPSQAPGFEERVLTEWRHFKRTKRELQANYKDSHSKTDDRACMQSTEDRKS
jgi:hypothetical protein